MADHISLNIVNKRHYVQRFSEAVVALDSAITAESRSLCWSLKHSLNAASGCDGRRDLEHRANMQWSRSGTHTHPVEFRGKRSAHDR